MIYVGIDQSYTCTGVVAIRSSEVVLEKTYKFKKENYQQMMGQCQEMVNDIRLTPPGPGEGVAVCIEGYAYASKFTNNLVHMGELGGLIKSCIVSHFEEITVLPPTTLKKFVTDKGNCKKELVMKEAFKKWGYDNNNNNLVDAFCIAKFIEALAYDDRDLSSKVNVIKWSGK